MKKHLPAGVFVLIAGILLGTGCKGDSSAQTEAPALGIPVNEYDLFASLIRNIDAAASEVERVRPTKNRVALRNAEALLAKERGTLNLLFTIKYGEETVARWTTTVHTADGTAASLLASQVKGKKLLDQFIDLGANGRLDSEGYITHLNCRNITLPDEIIQRIANCSKLQDLNLRNTGFKDDQFVHLENLTEIVSLDLSDNPITGMSIHKLGAMSKLANLSFAGSPVDDANVKQFEAIAHLKTVRTINISNTKLSTASYEKITRFFRLADVKH